MFFLASAEGCNSLASSKATKKPSSTHQQFTKKPPKNYQDHTWDPPWTHLNIRQNPSETQPRSQPGPTCNPCGIHQESNRNLPWNPHGTWPELTQRQLSQKPSGSQPQPTQNQTGIVLQRSRRRSSISSTLNILYPDDKYWFGLVSFL